MKIQVMSTWVFHIQILCTDHEAGDRDQVDLINREGEGELGVDQVGEDDCLGSSTLGDLEVLCDPGEPVDQLFSPLELESLTCKYSGAGFRFFWVRLQLASMFCSCTLAATSRANSSPSSLITPIQFLVAA